jgi:transposase
MDYLETELEELNRQIVTAMGPYKEEWKLLQTMPGIDQMSAAVLLAEIGTDMSCFGNKKRFSKWLGLCPGNNESAGKKKVDVRLKADHIVNTTACEMAHCATSSFVCTRLSIDNSELLIDY